ncbi:Neutral/alkaline non-lysosomal ceramidase [Roseimaritima multifibrata]|uniref:Neutral/alkaline non-lysosomal ceramidase n=1 Tax=Roseimaritima multifibrata TaxID=1930274 RepID=A0A517MNE0_9BACT|nr:neutral/alkaline non-lysosomal ceramidase N-terminal domain-containing protein [Roseimaritima multifibrata]QDS96390.1 Neutral/alkaline non-lysosomal ceramidase [Roseimaritima multifibrata]
MIYRPVLLILLAGWLVQPAAAELQVGATIVDVTPPTFPVLVNGGMLSRTADSVNTPVSARAIVVDDGQKRLAMVVVDSCMLPRPLLDDAKQLAAKRTKISADHMMISATHTHTAPSCMNALGTDVDTAYVSFFREKLVEAIVQAEKNLQPAKVGFAVGDAEPYTALRRWVRRSDRVDNDPFGNPTVRANMHSAKNWDNVTGPSGPEDPELSLIAFQALDGSPLAVLANYSMHYFSDTPISADYFGLFCNAIQDRLADEVNDSQAVSPVVIMSHGCSGDIWRRDYTIPEDQQPQYTIQSYTDALVDIAMDTYQTVKYDADADLEMAEQRLPMKYRVPTKQRLEWAEKIMADLGDNPLKTTEQVYAREQIALHQMQETEVVVQAIRIGEIGIATTPNETYALTGLKLKFQSPLAKTIVIELANGGDGYIPPPEQHILGGYNTWAARSAGLEVTAEPRIAATGLSLLETVAGKPRQTYAAPFSDHEQALLKEKPLAFWRLDEFAGPTAVDASGAQRSATYEDGVVFFLEGADPAAEPNIRAQGRAAHFAGGRMRTSLDNLSGDYSVQVSVWNGMPNEGRETTGWIFSRDHDDALSEQGEHLGIGGTASKPGCLIFQQGNGDVVVGSTPLERWTWNRVRMVRKGDQVNVYLNGAEAPELTATVSANSGTIPHVFFGGRSDNEANFEGRLDSISIRNE